MLNAERLHRLDFLLQEFAWLWRPQPFKEPVPSWCSRAPELQRELLSLRDNELANLGEDDELLIKRLSRHIPAIAEFLPLVSLAARESNAAYDVNPHLRWEIPGRKWQQIVAFSQCATPSNTSIVEWCGGKGHLGRWLATQWQREVTTLDWNPTLCRSGADLASRAKIQQRFVTADALSPTAANLLPQQHAVALHACGELHRRLVVNAVRQNIPALDIAPCCYYHLAGTVYRPISAGAKLTLSRDDLRLAVTNNATSSALEAARRNQEMAWKLGFIAWRQDVCNDKTYQPLNSIPKTWRQLDFAGFCRQLAQREKLDLSPQIDWPLYESEGWRRYHEVTRLSLARFAFRRALELWIVSDMAVFLEDGDYNVKVSVFCSKTITPRNLLLTARKNQAMRTA